MLTYLFYCFLAYLLYNVIFKFVLPIYRTTKRMKSSFNDMQTRMQGDTQQMNGTAQKKQKAPEPKVRKDEYIDFEEVK